ncbi:MAG TPA: nitroreductase family protein [Bacteroidales bacterium]|nr:nitroreductase family protein [Bacteroidales bacterium]
MKPIITLLFVVLIGIPKLFSQTENKVIDVLLSAYSERGYTNEPVTDQQLDLILKSGIKAPSAMNRQPWKFTVVKAEAAMKELMRDALPGNVLIIVSGADSPQGINQFDLGLATENMFIAAHGLGLGARIYMSPVKQVNSSRDKYQIPEGFTAMMVLRVGNVDKKVDAVSAASARKSYEEVVNFVK